MTFSRRAWITKGSRHGYNADVDGYLSSSSSSSSMSTPMSMSSQDGRLRQFHDQRRCPNPKAKSSHCRRQSDRGGASPQEMHRRGPTPKSGENPTTASYFSSVSSLTSLDANGDARRRNEIRFYVTIEPRRRGTKQKHGGPGNPETCESRKRRSRRGTRVSSASAGTGNGRVHPDIDLSLVSLLSSQEHDRRQMRRVRIAMNRGIIPRDDAFGGLSGLGTRESYCCSEDDSSTSVSSASSCLKSDSSCFSRDDDDDDDGNNIEEEDRFGTGRDHGSSANGNTKVDASTAVGKDGGEVLEKSKYFAKKSSSILTSSRPLAVIDYGSIQFGKLDMTGSLLDSIYQIGSGYVGETSTHGNNRNMQDIMDEKWNCKSEDMLAKSNNDDGRDYNPTDINENIPPNNTIAGTASSPPPTLGLPPILPPATSAVSAASAKKACVATLKPPRPFLGQSQSHPAMLPQSRPPLRATVASSRTPQVDAVIQSLKKKNSSFGSLQLPAGTAASKELNLFPTKRKRAEDLFSLDHGGDHKRRKENVDNGGNGCITKNNHDPIPILLVDKMTTTLEDAISFSPYARVLFDAKAPHIILHSNAAYSSLVNKGLVNPCIVGQAILDKSKMAENDDEHSSMFISNLVARHIGMIGVDHNNNSNDNNGSNGIHQVTNPRHELLAAYHSHIFPVLSDDKTFKDLVRSLQDHTTYRSSLLYRPVSECREHSASLEKKDYDQGINNSRNANHSSNPMVDSISNSQTLPFAKKSYRARRTKHSTSLPTGLYVSHYLLQIEPKSQIPKCTI